MKIQPSFIVHGGAWAIPEEEVEPHREGCRAAAKAGWEILANEGNALDAVETAIRVLEDDPAFDAGRGSWLNAIGEVELDAIIIDGGELRSGAVAAVQRVRNPISLARMVMERSQHLLLVAAGAEAFARAQGVPECPMEELLTPRELQRWKDMQASGGPNVQTAFGGSQPRGTVGAVALDIYGNIAAGTSTGGTPGKMPGRVGDSPLFGCGAYADAMVGGASTTGWGEKIMRVVLCKTAVDYIAAGMSAQSAAEHAIRLLDSRVDGIGGLIMIDKLGQIGVAFNTPHMARAWVTAEGNIRAEIE